MIGVVGCGANKLLHAAPARDLYTSRLFRLSLTYAEQHCETVYIASALHHIVMPHVVLSPYDCPIRRVSEEDRLKWARTIAQQLFNAHGIDHYVVLAGREYADPIKRELEELLGAHGCVLDVLRGMRIGERLAFLKAQTEGFRPRRTG